MVLRPALARISGAPRAMESTDAILFFARAQMSVMTPENQGRFEKCIELVELGALPPECLATVAEGIARKQRGNINKAPQTLQPDVTLRSGGGGRDAPQTLQPDVTLRSGGGGRTFLGRSACPSNASSGPPLCSDAPQTLQPDVTLRSGGRGSTFLDRSACPSNASSGPPLWSDVLKKGTWVPLKRDMYYDDATAQWKVFIPYRCQPAEGQLGKGQGKPGVGKCRGQSKGKKGGKGYFQKVKMSRSEDEALANLTMFLEEHPTFVFEPKAVQAAMLELYHATAEVQQNLLKQIQKHLWLVNQKG